MELDNDLITAILRYLQKNANYSTITLRFQDIPGENSNEKIDFHLEHCKDLGFVKSEGGLAAGHADLVSLRPKGLKYLQDITAPSLPSSRLRPPPAA